MVTGGTVETIFIDRQLIAALAKHAKELGESEEHLTQLFGTGGPQKDGILRHEHGHATHFHVRFLDPDSLALGKRVEPLLELHRPGSKGKPKRSAGPKPKPRTTSGGALVPSTESGPKPMKVN